MSTPNKDSHPKGRSHAAKVAKTTVAAVPEDSSSKTSSTILMTVEPKIASYMWKCDECNLRMNIGSKDSHLKGKKHRAAVASRTHIPATADTTAPAATSTTWSCNTCHLEMNILSKDSHLKGGEHRAAVLKSFSMKGAVVVMASDATSTKQTPKKHKEAASHTAGSSAQQSIQTNSSKAVKPAPASEMWKCEECDLRMNISSKDPHLKGKKHRAAVASSISASPPAGTIPPEATSTTWRCTECHLDINVSSKDSHLQGEKHRAAVLKKSSPVEATTTSTSTRGKTDVGKQKARAGATNSTPIEVTTASTSMQTKNSKGKQREAAGATTSTYITRFFAQYPKFVYNSSRPVTDEFYRLCDEHGWRNGGDLKEEARGLFKDALVQEFNHVYGTNVNDIESWRRLCHVVGINPIPASLDACRKAVDATHVNLVDLVDPQNSDRQVEIFPSELELSEYTLSTGKIFPRENAYAGGLLRYLLRHINHPRTNAQLKKARFAKKSREAASRTTAGASSQRRRHNNLSDDQHLLWCIDTQWGMIPGGGAYKESNFYSGYNVLRLSKFAMTPPISQIRPNFPSLVYATSHAPLLSIGLNVELLSIARPRLSTRVVNIVSLKSLRILIVSRPFPLGDSGARGKYSRHEIAPQWATIPYQSYWDMMEWPTFDCTGPGLVFHIENWLTASVGAEEALRALINTHRVVPAPVYDVNLDLIPPGMYRTKLENAVVEIQFTLSHWAIGSGPGGYNAFTAELVTLTVIEPPPVLAPAVKRMISAVHPSSLKKKQRMEME